MFYFMFYLMFYLMSYMMFIYDVLSDVLEKIAAPSAPLPSLARLVASLVYLVSAARGLLSDITKHNISLTRYIQINEKV